LPAAERSNHAVIVAIGVCEPNHLYNKVVQAGLACLILQSVQILHSFGFQPHKAIAGCHGRYI
jgi:hypothetical protein